MTAVEVFYDDLNKAGQDFAIGAELQFDATRLVADDPGVGAPLGRHLLKTELNRRMDELTEAIAAHGDAGVALAEAAFAIAARYSELDDELSGEGVP